ncbi:MAG: SMC family ATPase, partial [Pyrinomonadaceae bacterium]|nr:SMC family ATPase [Pyrinomonadaceae bacterium]
MHITKVELEDIKSHADAAFEFTPGSTAITGENGAGKTTILEAIAWTMFDVLDYKKDDFVRRGAKKGVARVTFQSGLDEREYTVYRDTGTGYYVYDPQLKMRIADKKEEVTRFLWQHLGVEAGTDLETLFKQAIGVPQGTFTAIFLATAAERKKTFDTLLKVEEYRRGADELLKTQRFVENQINAVNVKIARSEGELSRYEQTEAEREEAAAEAKKHEEDLERISAEADVKRSAVAELDRKEAAIAAAKAKADEARAEVLKIELNLKQQSAELDRSKEAASKVDTVRADAEKHDEVSRRIKELERERGERDKLRAELAKVEAAEHAVKTEERHLRSQLEDIAAAHEAIAKFKPEAEHQAELEKTAEELRRQIAHFKATAQRSASLESQLQTMRASYAKNKAELAEAREKAELAARVRELETRESELVEELARIKAGLERDEKFRSEIKNGFCPILSAKCLNLKEGETLEGFISVQFDEYRSRISVLEVQHVTVRKELTVSREAEKFAARIATLEERSGEIEAEGKRLKAEKEEIDKAIGDAEKAEADLHDAEQRLGALNDPRSKLNVAENAVAREAVIREKLSETEKNLERLESDRRITVEQLETYKDLDAMWAEATTTRDGTAEAHRTFIAFEAAAKLLPGLEEAVAALQRTFVEAEKGLTDAENELNAAAEGYDRTAHVAERDALAAAERAKAETGVRAENARKRLDALTAELERLAETLSLIHISEP